MGRTKDFLDETSESVLFLTDGKLQKKASKNLRRRRISEILNKGCTDVNKFKPYSTRHALSSQPTKSTDLQTKLMRGDGGHILGSAKQAKQAS